MALSLQTRPTLQPPLPTPRGPLSELLLDRLRRPASDLPPAPDPLSGGDANLALYCCYELHYRGFEDVDGDWEWHPSLVASGPLSSPRCSRTRRS